jgi:LysR family transcriptional regulator, nod-box dependent transcriptional activator
MRFQRLDLNLLVALEALLSERSVSLAAERICLSQSATSSALGRLREYFGDELLVVKGRQMVLTSRAEALVDPVRAVLEQIRSTISVSPPFDPATSDRKIRLMASDYLTEVLLATALSDLLAEAPAMQFEIAPMADSLVESLERGLIDILLTIDYAISADHPSQLLFEDDYVVVGWDQNPALAEEISRDVYFELGHVAARFGKARTPVFDDWFVRRQSQQRRVEVVAPSFLAVPGFIIGTNRITTMHRRLAKKISAYLPLVMREVPLAIPSIREAVQWHISNNNDPAIRWVVERLVAVAAEKPEVKSPANVVRLQTGKQKSLSHDEITQQFQAATAHRNPGHKE